MTKLLKHIREMIALEGPVTVEHYMELCLGHYYATRDPFGTKGDFITAPEISQMFGELAGLWAAEVWRMLGKPGRIHWVELGPGRGTLTADALRAARLLPEFLSALDVHLVETSPVLRQRQKVALGALGWQPTWHGGLDTLPQGPLIIVANEFFDALPVRQFVASERGWHERCIGLDEADKLHFGLAPGLESLAPMPPTPGVVREIPTAGTEFMRRLADRIVRQNGAALIIDYGYAGPRLGDSLQGVHRHGYADPLALPGEADLTTHVDFQYLASTAHDSGASVHGLSTQGDFLRALGIDMRAAALKRSAGNAAAIDIALSRLTGSNKGEMGELFKVMAISSPGLAELPGLNHCNSSKLLSP